MSSIRPLLLSSLLAALACALPASGRAAVSYGGYTFADIAFATDATQLEAGFVHWLTGGTVDPDDAILDAQLTGFSPTTGLANIGFPDPGVGAYANLFELDFTVLPARNAVGPDIVLFEAFGPDPYEIAVRPRGGVFTDFLTYAENSLVELAATGPLDSSPTYALEIDISAFGLPAGTVVDAIRLRALQNSFGNVEGDPFMAAVANPVPVPAALWLAVPVLVGLAAIRRRGGAGMRS
ncbi:MAG: hypothetical protein IT495_09025 [Gammaproteobacteria bacterium]|nr:hypothetical protein [Gammaproteobacteria bacterium]